MSNQDIAELPAPLGNSRPEDPHQEDDPFSDKHHISSEEDLYSAELQQPHHESLSQPAELPALVKQRAKLLASLKQKSPTSVHVQSDSGYTSNTPVPAPPAEASKKAPNRGEQQDAANLMRSPGPAAAPFTDHRPMLERVPAEYYSPPLIPRTIRGLPKATDVPGRYIAKKAVSRAALELAGVAFTECDDHVLLHKDPGPIALRDLRVASVAMQHPADWWRQLGPDDPAYPHELGRAAEAAEPERRDVLYKTLVAPWKRRARDTQAEQSRSGAVGSSRAASAGPSRVRPSILHESDSEEEGPVKHVYH